MGKAWKSSSRKEVSLIKIEIKNLVISVVKLLFLGCHQILQSMGGPFMALKVSILDGL